MWLRGAFRRTPQPDRIFPGEHMQTKSTVTAEPAGSGDPPDAVPRSRVRITPGRMILAVAVPVLFSGLTAQAQQPAGDPQTSWSLSITPAHQFSANLDAGRLLCLSGQARKQN